MSRQDAEEVLVGPALTLALIPFLYGAAWLSLREQISVRRAGPAG